MTKHGLIKRSQSDFDDDVDGDEDEGDENM